MEFRSEEVENFIRLFHNKKQKILKFEGCQGLKLLQDINDPNIIWTHSIWTCSQKLEDYRSSEFFKETWTETKKLFKNRPEAWSLKEN